jgi:ferric-dicitrate binding protein FerR (iron transport regulator)
MKEERFQALLEQYITSMINKEDLKEFHLMLEDPRYRALLEKAMENEWNLGLYEEVREQKTEQLIEHSVLTRIRAGKVISIRTSKLYRWRVAAAIILLGMLSGAFFLIFGGAEKQLNPAAQQPALSNDITPGGNKAVLVLTDGREIELDSSQKGFVINQNGALVTKKEQGLVVYESTGTSEKVYMNTLRTPLGGEYQIKLSDGTSVWLNAASSIRFPVTFYGGERKVEVTGEAYFDVAYNPGIPFRIAAKGMQVEVLGTHFNINAYENESIVKTTLVEGKVKIASGEQAATLLPGQQARISTNDILTVVKVDTAEAIAWKKGAFQFHNADVRTVMRQIERWYNVEVVYKGVESIGHFNGTIPRKTKVSQLIRILEVGGISCRIEGKKIVVL